MYGAVVLDEALKKHHSDIIARIVDVTYEHPCIHIIMTQLKKT